MNEALQHIRRKKRYQRITETISQQPRWAEPVHEDPSVSLDVHDALDRLPDRMREMVVREQRPQDRLLFISRAR